MPITLGAFQQVANRDLAYLHPNAGGVLIQDRYYLISGESISTDVSTPEIESTRLMADGVIEAWETALTLPESRRMAASAASHNSIFIVGNHPGTGLVTRIAVDVTGQLTGYTAVAPLAQGRYWAQAFIHGDYLYAVGGAHAGKSPPELNIVERAKMNANGTLAAWEPAPTLNLARYRFGLVKTASYVWVVGGTSSSGALGLIERAPLLADGAIGAWEIVSLVGPARAGVTVVHAGDCLIAVGGAVGGGLSTDVTCIRLNAVEHPIAVETLGKLTLGRAEPGVFVHPGGYLYVIGGTGEAAALPFWKTIERAAINR